MPLKPAISTPARETLRTAFEDLQRTITPADAKDFPSTTLNDVRKAVLDIENQLAARQCLRNMRRLSPFLKGLGHYAKVAEVLCNGTPYLPWVWAPITFILQAASEFVEAFEKVIKGYSRISSSMSRFEILSDAFIGNPDFQETLAIFYADILQFHKHAYVFVKRSGWKLLFLTSWDRFDKRFKGILEDMVRHEALVDLEANARSIYQANKAHQEVQSWREEHLGHVIQVEQEQAMAHYQSILSWLKVDESDQLAIFDSVCLEGQRYPGTCSWVLKHSKVNAWLRRQPDTPVLWLQGSPGSGKSVISAQLVKFLGTNYSVIHHFCTSAYPTSIKYEEILKSLLLQLLKRDGDICAHIYRRCVEEKKSPTRAILEQLLRTTFSSFCTEPSKNAYIWVVLDGLDECEDNTKKRFVTLMNQISSETPQCGGTVCKMLLSSRPSPVLSSSLRRKNIISLTEEEENVAAAIRLYTCLRLGAQFQKSGQLEITPDELTEIEHNIVKKADGMFLYARLVLDYIMTNIFYSADEIRTSVGKLPPKLSDFYHEILSRILVCLDSRSKTRIKCVLSWIAFAKRPLKRLELLSAISFSEGTHNVSNIAPAHILDICGPLTEERSDTTLTFIHVSVKEFLQSNSSNLTISEPDSIMEHGAACVACLLSGFEVFGDLHQRSLTPQELHRVIKGLHGLHVYATEYWTDYLLSQASTPAGLNTSSIFFTLACQLAKRLDADADTSLYNDSTVSRPSKDHVVMDKRLDRLRNHPGLQRQVNRALEDRSIKKIETEHKDPGDQAGLATMPREMASLVRARIPMGIAGLLDSYQRILRTLLASHDHPRATIQELELFKGQFRTFAYTCRLKSCPRSTLGFETEEKWRQHESGHLCRLQCTVPGCSYALFFTSERARKNHIQKHHSSETPPRRSIRKSKSDCLAGSNARDPIIYNLSDGQLVFSSDGGGECHFYEYPDLELLQGSKRKFTSSEPQGLGIVNAGGANFTHIADGQGISQVSGTVYKRRVGYEPYYTAPPSIEYPPEYMGSQPSQHDYLTNANFDC